MSSKRDVELCRAEHGHFSVVGHSRGETQPYWTVRQDWSFEGPPFLPLSEESEAEAGQPPALTKSRRSDEAVDPGCCIVSRMIGVWEVALH